jgi:virginiamycin B lyase
MRKMTLVLLAALALQTQSQSARPPRPGVSTPGVRIPITKLKPDAVYSIGGAPDWMAIDDETWVSNSPKNSVSRMDPKSNIFVTVDVGKEPCSGLAAAFGSLWVPNCGDSTITRVSFWILTDTRGTLARIDPDTNKVVAEIYVPPGSFAVAFGEGAVWVTSTERSVVTRINQYTNVIEASIPVGPKPRFLTVGEGGVWTLNQGDGSVSRIDPKTNKVAGTIELGVPGGGGEISAGEGSVWVTAMEYPLTRIDPATNIVAQQFFGDGGDSVRAGRGWVWLTHLRAGLVWRLDPRRIEATQ